MGRLQVLMWIACVVISGNSSSDSQLRHRYLNVRANHKNLRGEMFDLKTDADFEFKQLANRTFIRMNENEAERLKTGYSHCFRDRMELLRGDIGILMIKEYPVPCSGLLTRVLYEIEDKITEERARIGVVIDRIDKCMHNSQDNCTSSDEVRTFHRQLSRLRHRWLQYKRYKFVPTWRKMMGCFANLSVAIETKLSELSKQASKCTSVSHRQFFNENGLRPFTIHHLIGSSMDWFRIEESPSSSPTRSSKYQEKSEIMRTLNSLRTDIMQYVSKHMIFGMRNIINIALENFEPLVTFLTNPEALPNGYRSCYNEGIEKVRNRTRKYYETQLNNICFYGLVDAKNDFMNIVQCDLRVFEGRLSGIKNCWANQELCQDIASKLEKFNSSLNAWNQFNLDPMIKGAMDCYSKANQLIYQITSRSVDSLRTCESIPLAHIYNEITKNVQPYPSYERSELCFLQPSDIFVTQPW